LSKTYDDLKLAERLQRGSSVVSAGLRVKGEISGNEDLLVNGIVECPIQLEEKMLTVGPRGKLTANVVAREVIVFGEVKGNLVVRDRIQIKKEGSVEGDLKAGGIVIEDGASFKGSIEVVRQVTGSTSQENPSQSFAATASAATPKERLNRR
jgi:cytoskeletal protein CcmA (bactofilin family)